MMILQAFVVNKVFEEVKLLLLLKDLFTAFHRKYTFGVFKVRVNLCDLLLNYLGM